jgi:hypothetical protein
MPFFARASRLRATAATVGGLLLALYLGFSWIDAGREVRVLCTMFPPETTLDAVLTTLDTGDYLHYDVKPSGERTEIVVGSYYNLLHTACTVDLNGDVVTTATYRTWAQRYLLFGS